MLKVDSATKTLVRVTSTTLTQSKILERAHLQEAIVRSWEAFTNELGYEELFLVATEVVPHDSCRDRIDLLAITQGGSPVVIELKRHRDRLQLLQAISYAAMIAKWDAARFLQALGTKKNESADEIRALLQDETFELKDPEIILIAESFDPEVILAADWLSRFRVPISAFAITGVEHEGTTLISIDQRFPLAGVDDVYVSRTHRAAVPADGTTWDEVVKNVSFPFAKRAVEVFQRSAAGSPHFRRFNSIYGDSPLGRMSISFRENYLKVYTADQTPEAEKTIRELLEPIIPVSLWGNESTQRAGFTFTIKTPDQFAHFLKAVGEPQ
jgi:hypothetical protein